MHQWGPNVTIILSGKQQMRGGSVLLASYYLVNRIYFFQIIIYWKSDYWYKPIHEKKIQFNCLSFNTTQSISNPFQRFNDNEIKRVLVGLTFPSQSLFFLNGFITVFCKTRDNLTLSFSYSFFLPNFDHNIETLQKLCVFCSLSLKTNPKVLF